MFDAFRLQGPSLEVFEPATYFQMGFEQIVGLNFIAEVDHELLVFNW